MLRPFSRSNIVDVLPVAKKKTKAATRPCKVFVDQNKLPGINASARALGPGVSKCSNTWLAFLYRPSDTLTWVVTTGYGNTSPLNRVFQYQRSKDLHM